MKEPAKRHLVVTDNLHVTFIDWRPRLVTYDPRHRQGMDAEGRLILLRQPEGAAFSCALYDSYEIDHLAPHRDRRQLVALLDARLRPGQPRESLPHD